MAPVGRTVSVVFLAGGVTLVFVGLNTAVGFSAPGILASVAAIAALLYSGAVWFGAPPVQPRTDRDPIFVFDRTLREVCGPRRGHAVTASFPPAERASLESECWAALAGERGRFSSGDGRTRSQFDVLPLRTTDGAISFGVLIDVEARHESLPQRTTLAGPTAETV